MERQSYEKRVRPPQKQPQNSIPFLPTVFLNSVTSHILENCQNECTSNLRYFTDIKWKNFKMFINYSSQA